MKVVRFTFLLLFISCQNTTRELPILSYKINKTGEKETYKITYNNFTNQLGESFTTKAIKDKVFVANFFFTSCPSICPPMQNELIKIAENFKTKTNFILISHTIDPQNDTVEVLKHYAENTGIPHEKWHFIRSSVEQTKKQAKQYMTNFKPNKDGTDFYHSTFVALVDNNQLIPFLFIS